MTTTTDDDSGTDPDMSQRVPERITKSQRAAEVRIRRMAERCGGLQLVKLRRYNPPYVLCDPKGRDPKANTWGKDIARLRGQTLKQIEAELLRRNPSCVSKNLNWEPIMLKAKQIVQSYDTKVTLRQLFYQLVARQLIENEQKRYKYLSKLTAEARREGWFPDLVDQTSEILVAKYFSSPEQGKQYLRSIYRRDRTEGQEVTIYLAVEKAGIQAQLWDWFADLGLPILALGGYGSQTYKDQIKAHVHQHIYVDAFIDGEKIRVRADADMIKVLGSTKASRRKLLDAERPAVLIYAGDHDASGDDIFRDLVQRTDPGAELSDDYTTVTRSRLWKAVHRIALTKEQAADLPQNPGKDDDTRADGFMERHGYTDNIQVELDALSPDVLRGLYQSVIDQYWDANTYDAVVKREGEERQELWSDDDDEDDDQ
jgi:hypothetical protein